MITARDVRPVMRVLSLVGGDDVATDKGDYNFVARWRGLWSWDCYRDAEGGSNTARFECQYSSGSANKRRSAYFSG
jgi:hypothetical protein